MSMDLARRIERLRQSRRRCSDMVRVIEDWEWETATACNVCGSQEITLISREDRYGLRHRSGLCRFCGLVFLIDRLTAEGYERFYAEMYRPLVGAFLGCGESPKRLRASQERYAQDLINSLRGLLQIPDGGRLLDIGGSTGFVSSALAREFGVRALVLDPSPQELEVARQEGHETECGLFESWKGDGRTFDLILCARTIDHFMDLSGALRKMRRLISDDGWLLIDIVDLYQIRDRRGVIDGAFKVDHCYYLYSEIAPAVLASAGWKVVISDIATATERVLYACRPTEASEIEAVPEESISAWLRRLQLERSLVSRTPPRLSAYRRLRLTASRTLRRFGL